LVSVGAVSAIPLTGLLLLRQQTERVRLVALWLVSFAIGALLGGAVLHLMPEAFERFGSGPAAPLYLLAGFLGFFVLEKFLWLHGHDRATAAPARLQPVAMLNLVGDGLHNLLDGMLIAAAYSAEPSLGLATTIAVILHEVPQEIGDFGILIYSGLSLPRAVLFNFLSGAVALAGAAVTLMIGQVSVGFTDALLPVAAGGFIYIAASDLVPELRKEESRTRSLGQIGLVVLGIGFMALPKLVS
jgi:zinc and cadmium transporter